MRRNAPTLTLLCFLTLAAVVASPPGWCQDVTGDVEGRAVAGPDRQPVAGATIVVDGPALQGQRATTSDDDGYFRLAAVPPGVYNVTLRHVTYRETRLEGVAVRLGKTTALGRVQLDPAALEMPPVTVRAARPLIDPTSTTSGGNLSRAEFELLPTERNYRTIVALLPQANTSFYGDEVNVGGATGLENMYFIDGINVTDPYTATTGTNLPYNFVQAIELKSGGYQAEFGRATGGIINVVTGSGSNEFGGNVFGYYTSDGLAGNTRPGVADATVESFTNYDAGFSVSGPIVRDRLWYYLAYDRESVDQDVVIPGFGAFPDRQDVDMFAGKLTFKAGPDTDLVLTALGDPSERNLIGPYLANQAFPAALGNPDPLLAYEKSGGTNVSLSARTFVGSKALLDTSIAFYQRDSEFSGGTTLASTEPVFKDLTNGTWSGGYGTRNEAHTERLSLNAETTLFLGRHTFKAGLQYEDNQLDVFQQSTGPGIIDYNGAVYRAIFTGQDSRVNNRAPALYAQDSWRVTDRLRLNLGLRWGQQLLRGTHGGRQDLDDEWQPRLGFTYLPGTQGTQKIYGSVGRFYSQLPLRQPSFVYTVWDNHMKIYSVDPRQQPDSYDTLIRFTGDEPDWPETPGLEGEHLDELTFGYERLVAQRYRFGARGTYRSLQQAFTSGIVPGTVDIVGGNPGSGDLDFLSEVERDYWSVELTFAGSGGPRFDFLASYVLSRNEGNYPGLYDSDNRFVNPNNSIMYRLTEQMTGNHGLLPNDRSHALKLYGAYRFGKGFSVGAHGYWMSGTPLSELGASWLGFGHHIFLQRRGTAGRTPSIWDANLRLQYQLGAKWRAKPKLVLDMLHIGSERAVVAVDQVHYLSQDGSGGQGLANPNYLGAVEYQSPTVVRLGFELAF